MTGLKINHAIEKKKAFEKSFQEWANKNTANPHYKSILPRLAAGAKKIDSLLAADQHIKEDVLGIELIQQGAALEKFVACFRAGFTDSALHDTLQKLTA